MVIKTQRKRRSRFFDGCEKRVLGETNRVAVEISGLVVTQHVGSRCSSRTARNPQDSGGELVGLLISEGKFW